MLIFHMPIIGKFCFYSKEIYLVNFMFASFSHKISSGKDVTIRQSQYINPLKIVRGRR